MDRTERLLDLVALLLDAREPVSFADLRLLFPDEYGGPQKGAERKLERDKAELVQLGVPLEYVEPRHDGERDLGGYRIDRQDFFLPDPRLLPEEAAALYAAGATALAAHDFPFAQDLQHALRKISLAGSGPQSQQAVPGAMESALGSAAARRLLIVRPGDPNRAGKLRALGDAVARRKRVHVVYQAPPALDGRPGERTERDVSPYGLAFRAGSWRLVGHCHLRQAQRVFVIDRIESLAVNDARPSSPDFEIPDGFDAGSEAGRRPWQWVGTTPHEVVLQFAPGSELLAERAFDARAEATVRLQVTYLDGLLPQVLSMGDRVWITSPPDAREKAVQALRTLAARLEKPPDPAPEAEPGRGLASIPAGTLQAAPEGAQAAPDGVTQAAPEAGRQPQGDLQRARPPEVEDKRERLRRLLLVVPAARRRPGIQLDELARELGLDASQLRADIDLLGFVGRPPFSPDDLIDISVDERGRVSVALDQSFSRPPQLTATEALALAAAAEEVAPADPAVVAALGKLTDKLTPAARQLYSALARRVAAATPPPPGTEGILAQLRAAAQAHREVVLEYDKEGRGAAPDRTLRPQGVVDHAGRWYVMGHDVEKGAERTFRVDRIRAVRETSVQFQDPGALDPLRFQREQLFFPSGHEQRIVLRFSETASPWARLRYGSRARALPQGGADVWIDSAGYAYAVSLALSLAGEAEIVGPEDARAALRDEVQRTLRRYAS